MSESTGADSVGSRGHRRRRGKIAVISAVTGGLVAAAVVAGVAGAATNPGGDDPAKSADTLSLGTITNYAPGYVFASDVPDRAEVESTVHEGALSACRNDYPATTDAVLISFTQEGSGGLVTSVWDCV